MTHAMPEPPPHLPLTRRELSGALALSLIAASLCLVRDLPVPRAFCAVAAFSFVIHLPLWLWFDAVARRLRSVIVVYNVIDSFVLAASMHYTGGVLSPFVMAFVGMMISDSAYGIEYRYGFFPVVGAYLAVIAAEALGWWTPVPVTPAAFYRSPALLALVVLNMLGILYAAGFLYRNLIELLRSRLKAEQAEKQAAQTRIAELEPKAQKSVVVSRLAHDIRGYLTPIKGTLEEAARAGEGQEGYLRVSAENALATMARVEDFTTRLLAYAHNRDVKSARVDLWDLLDHVLRMTRHIEGADVVDFHITPAPVTAVCVMGYRDELERVYFNLVKNAVESLQGRPEPRQVLVTVAAYEGRAIVLVRDTGPGMEPATAEKALRGGFSTKTDGNGEGLLIAREGVLAHDGQLSLDTAPGRGTEFRTSYPLAKETA